MWYLILFLIFDICLYRRCLFYCISPATTPYDTTTVVTGKKTTAHLQAFVRRRHLANASFAKHELSTATSCMSASALQGAAVFQTGPRLKTYLLGGAAECGMGVYCISPVAMELDHGELAHRWARTLATTTGMRKKAARCAHLASKPLDVRCPSNVRSYKHGARSPSYSRRFPNTG